MTPETKVRYLVLLNCHPEGANVHDGDMCGRAITGGRLFSTDRRALENGR